MTEEKEQNNQNVEDIDDDAELNQVDRNLPQDEFESQIAEAKEKYWDRDNAAMYNALGEVFKEDNKRQDIYVALISEEGYILDQMCRCCILAYENYDDRPDKVLMYVKANFNLTKAIMLARLFVEYDFVVWVNVEFI